MQASYRKNRKAGTMMADARRAAHYFCRRAAAGWRKKPPVDDHQAVRTRLRRQASQQQNSSLVSARAPAMIAPIEVMKVVTSLHFAMPI